MMKVLLLLLCVKLSYCDKWEFNAQLINGTCSLKHYMNNDQVNDQFEFNLDHINMGFIDASMFIIMSVANLFFQIVLITFFVKYKKLREPPGDILVGISICELFLAFHWLSSGLHYFFYGKVKNTSNFCQINSVVSVYFNTIEYIYNCAICIYFIYKIRRVVNLKARSFDKITRYVKNIYIHFLIFGFILLIVYGLNHYNKLGKSLSGTCSVVGISEIPFVSPFVWFFYVILSIFTLVYFKQKVPELKNSKFENLKKKQLVALHRYIMSCTIIWFFITICNIMLSVDCMNKEQYNPADPDDQSRNYVFITFNNILKTMNSMVLTYLRYKNPVIQKSIQNFKNKLTKQKSQKDKFQIPNNMESSLISKYDFSESLAQQMKENLGFTLLASLGIYFRMKQPSLLEQTANENYENMADNSTNEISYAIDPNNETVNDEYSDHININNEILNDMKIPYSCDLSVIASNLTVYFPQTFLRIREEDKEFFFMEQSLDLDENVKNIQKSGQADGGRGGDWFLFTYDDQLVIKTMSNEDLENAKRIMTSYSNYIQMNKGSLLVKIYGIFTLQTLNNEEQHFYLMKNMNHCNKKFILAQYDLKGSLREVVETNQIELSNISSNEQLEKSKKVLKELNFINNEKNIYIEEQFKEKIINQLIKDSQFLMNLGIMDYSLFVSKVDHQKMKQQMIKQNMFNEMYLILTLEKQNQMMLKVNCVPSQDPNVSLHFIIINQVYYHFGLIDYLQLFNTQRKIQQFKNVFNRASSCFEPIKYQDKFIQFMRQIFDQQTKAD